MNRAIVKLISSSTRIMPRIYAGSSAASSKDHHASKDVHHQEHGHHDDHGHGHHHHEPELRKTQAWRHHSGILSKYENQSEDPDLFFTQEFPHSHDYRLTIGEKSLMAPYRSHVALFPIWHYHLALILSIWLWWYVAWRFGKESSFFFGHAHFPDVSKFTDEELGIPPDDLD